MRSEGKKSRRNRRDSNYKKESPNLKKLKLDIVQSQQVMKRPEICNKLEVIEGIYA